MVEHAGVGGRVRPGGAPDGLLVDVDHLVEGFGAVDALVQAGRDLGLVDALHQRPVQDVVDQGGLARPRHAGDGDEAAQRDVDVDVGEVVLPGAPDGEPVVSGNPAAFGHRDRLAARQVLAGERPLVLQQIGHRAGVDHGAAVLAGAGADVHHVVGHPHGLLVVLHHQHGVAQVAHPLQGVDEAAVVPLVQADGGLVEHIEHAHQAAADLGGQPDALGLSPAEGAG